MMLCCFAATEINEREYGIMEELLNLKAWMVLNKVTQKDFAKTLGVSSTTICNKMNGRRSFTLREIKCLNSAYGVEANTFM